MGLASSGLTGKLLMPREIAEVAHEYWRNYELTKAIAVALGESAGSLGAWHDNLTELRDCSVDQVVLNPELGERMTVLNPATGKLRLEDGTIEFHPPESEVVVSRDCGLYQINIPARQAGTARELELRTESKDPTVWKPVLEANVENANALYLTAWSRNGKPDIRAWQPWVAYTTGWATFPEAWVWLKKDGESVGPWVHTGRYIHRAIAGQMNYHVVILKDWTAEKALKYAKLYAEHFGVKGVTYSIKNGVVAATYDKAPEAPPADGVGPRPVPNDGR